MAAKKLTSCSWIDSEGRLHISVPEMLRELGVPDTPENRERYTDLAAAHLATMLRDRPAVIEVTE